MKKLVITGLATLALALGAFAQGSVDVGNAALVNPYIDNGALGTHYGGPYGLSVWELNATAVPADLSGINGTVGNNNGYGLLAGDGFTLAKTWAGQTMSGGGFDLGELDMPSVSPKGGTVVLALGVWNSTAATWDAAVAAAANGGMVVFANPTADYTILPPNTPTPANLTGWDALGTSIVMTPLTSTPEPSVLALAGLGAAALLVIRRRK